MDMRLLNLLREQIAKLEGFKNTECWGPEYQIWKNTTSKLVRALFGAEYVNLYEQQETRCVSAEDGSYNQRVYIDELESMKRFLSSAIDEFQRLEAGSALSIGRSAGLSDYDLHARIREVVGTKYEDGHYAEAVESGFKEVIKRVKDYVSEKNGGNLDGAKAMGRAFDFGSQEPLIKFNRMQSLEEQDEQRGVALLFKGIVFIRNRKAHENITLTDPHRALEYLALASLLMRLLDEYAK